VDDHDLLLVTTFAEAHQSVSPRSGVRHRVLAPSWEAIAIGTGTILVSPNATV
jgi:hypothetical protein